MGKQTMGATTKLVLFLSLVLCFTFGQARPSDPGKQCNKVMSRQGVSHGSSEDWDMLVFTQFWPPAACTLLELTSDKCDIKSLNSWVIHGLWPTKSGTKKPDYCNSSSAFEPSQVEALRSRLQVNWPTIERGDDPENVWTHEWCKHGTCGTSLPALRDELHYFNITLGLHDRINVSSFLSSGNILPSEEKTYTYDEIYKILHQKAGSNPHLACAKDRSNGKCYLEQIELCLTKSFTPIDCDSHGKHDLLFQSETAISRRRGESTCSCESEALYYKPFPSM